MISYKCINYHFCFLDVNHIHPRLHPDRELLWDGSCSFCHPGRSQLQTVQENQGNYIDDDYRGNDVLYPARAQSARARRAHALRALGLLLADSAPTVGGGKTF